MGIKLKPSKEIISRLQIEEYGPLHKYMAERAMVRMNAKYVPEKNGVLHDTSRVDTSDCSIHYEQQYAGYQYYGQRKDGTHKIVKHTKPGTGPYWDKLMMSAEGNDLRKDLEKALKSGRF